MIAPDLCRKWTVPRMAIRGQLFEVSATDPASFAGVALLIVAAGLIASYVPASRAAAVDPMLSLRH
jgi:putative ABC transport system permease protein